MKKQNEKVEVEVEEQAFKGPKLLEVSIKSFIVIFQFCFIVRRESRYSSYNCVRKLIMCCQNSCLKWNTDATTNKMFCTYFKTQNCKLLISIICSKSEINSSTQKYSSQEITWIWSHKNPLLILKKCTKIFRTAKPFSHHKIGSLFSDNMLKPHFSSILKLIFIIRLNRISNKFQIIVCIIITETSSFTQLVDNLILGWYLHFVQNLTLILFSG